MSQWDIYVITDEAAQEVASLFANTDIKQEVERLLKILIQQQDPAAQQSHLVFVSAK